MSVQIRIYLTFAITLGVLVFYEGLPFVRNIPFIEKVPFIGEISIGRVGKAFINGAHFERASWERAKADLLLKQAAERKAAQAKIAEIEKSYLSKLTNKDAAYSDLEAALEAERIDAEKADAVAIARNKPGEETQPCVCVRPPAVSKRVRDLLENAKP